MINPDVMIDLRDDSEDGAYYGIGFGGYAARRTVEAHEPKPESPAVTLVEEVVGGLKHQFARKVMQLAEVTAP